MNKILLVLENSPYDVGGIERHCKSIIDMFNSNKDVSIDYLCKDNIMNHFNQYMGKIVFDTKSLSQLISSYDVIHIHGFASYIVSQAIKSAISQGKKVVYTPHFHPFYTLNRPFLGKLFFNVFLKNHLKYIDTIISINNDDKAFFEKYNSNVVMLPNWNTGLEPVIMPKNKNMILGVGRNDSNKALYHLNAIDFDSYDVHCVTKNNDKLDKRIKIWSNIDDATLSRLYTQASLLVVPSRYEAFSYVALEALERGTPILISDRVRIYDHLKDINGVTVFEFDNLKDFVVKIPLAISQKVDTVLVTERFSAKNIRNKLTNIYLNGKI